MEIRQILDGVESMEMVMPEFQREYVWPIEDAKQLINSSCDILEHSSKTMKSSKN